MYLRFELIQNSKHENTEPPYYPTSLSFFIYNKFICTTGIRIQGCLDRFR